jgi:hypothetical protein
MSIAGLTAVEGNANTYVKDYCSHNYPQSPNTADLAGLMGHSQIATQIKPFASEVSAAAAQGKSHIFGETESGITVHHSLYDSSLTIPHSHARRRWN